MFFDPHTSKKVSVDRIVEIAKDYDIIVFGERHDSKDCHRTEFELLKALSQKYKLIFSLEMFERDVQPILDNYLAGKISEDEFLQNSRPWSNYQDDYRPLIEYCKENKIHVVAANVPRYIASKVAKGGLSAIKELSTREREFMADTVFYDEPEYRARFYETMEHVHMPGFSSKMKENYYRAQCIKDATMAESIVKAIKSMPGYKVFHINGSFHSDYHKGVVWQLLKMEPGLKVLVISPLGEKEKYEKLPGDFIFYYKN